jgi:lipopolysaccharide transport system ATP-binding protein
MSGTAIRFTNVSKAYDLKSGSQTLVSSLRMVTGAGRADRMFHALSDVSFEVGRGEAFGIIGRNGAGKSTILKIIAGITKPTAGVVEVNGLVSSLIELGAGFHPDMTGRENVYMSGAILGISRKFIDRKFKEIVDFAELWDFIDVPVKKYSSGMYARLGFSVAVSVEPEILIVDEILSVGDVFFQQRCFAKMREIIREGTTFVFVTHDNAAMQNLCERALLLESGKVDYIGTTLEAVSRYYAKVGQKPGRGKFHDPRGTVPRPEMAQGGMSPAEVSACSILSKSSGRHGARGLEVIAARVTGSDGMDTLRVEMSGKLRFTLLLRANEEVHDPSCGIHLYDRMGTLVFSAGSRQLRFRLPDLIPGERLVVAFSLTFSVQPGEYTFSLGTSEPSLEGSPNVGFIHDRHEMLGPISVVADDAQIFPFYGIANLPLEFVQCSAAGKEG